MHTMNRIAAQICIACMLILALGTTSISHAAGNAQAAEEIPADSLAALQRGDFKAARELLQGALFRHAPPS